MKTVFALFTEIDNAKEAVYRLLSLGFEEKQINAVIQETVAKDFLDIRRHEVTVEKTDALGSKEKSGLESLLGGRQAVKTPDCGNIYAAGESAAILAKTAAAFSEGGGIKNALQDFDISSERAQFYRSGITRGGILLWIRTDDNRAGEIITTIEQYKAQRIISIP